MGTIRPGDAVRAVAVLLLPALALQGAASTSAVATSSQPQETPLTVAVTAGGTVARAYGWSIEKAVDTTTRSTDSTGTATFGYTVTARAGASTDSGWAVAGTVTVTNPHGSADGAITADVAVASSLGGGSACTVTGGNDVVVPPSPDGTGQVTLPYTCSFATAPAVSGTVTATATWDPAGPATTTTADGSAPAVFAVTSETNRTVAVVDDRAFPGRRVVLAPSLTWSPGLVTTYAYDLVLAGGAPGACAVHTNTATIDQPSGTDPGASATVRACTPEVLPAEAYGAAVGAVHVDCRGTVRTRMSNRTAGPVAYTLRVGSTVHRIVVKSLRQKKFVTRGRARATVTLKVGSTRLDRIRIPQRCEAPQVLPDTGLRVGSR